MKPSSESFNLWCCCRCRCCFYLLLRLLLLLLLLPLLLLLTPLEMSGNPLHAHAYINDFVFCWFCIDNRCFGRNDWGQLGAGHALNIGDVEGEMGDELPR